MFTPEQQAAELQTAQNLRNLEARMKALLNKAGIPVKSVTMTRATVIVTLYGQKHTERVASYLKGAGFTRINIFDNRPSLFHANNTPDWRVTAFTSK